MQLAPTCTASLLAMGRAHRHPIAAMAAQAASAAAATGQSRPTREEAQPEPVPVPVPMELLAVRRRVLVAPPVEETAAWAMARPAETPGGVEVSGVPP